jgi:hypothetical protein
MLISTQEQHMLINDGLKGWDDLVFFFSRFHFFSSLSPALSGLSVGLSLVVD